MFKQVGVHLIIKNPYKSFPWLDYRPFRQHIFVQLPKYKMTTPQLLKSFDAIAKTLQKPLILVVDSREKLVHSTASNLLANGIDSNTIAISVSFFHKNNLTFIFNRQLIKKVS